MLHFFEDKIDELMKLINVPDEFTNFCIQFAFIHYDLKKLFPEGSFNKLYKLDESAAENWWKEHFNNDLFVKAEEFGAKISKRFSESPDIHCLLQSISFTKFDWYGNINKCSFNNFLKYYGGWENFPRYWSQIFNNPAHLHMVTMEYSTEKLLKVKSTLGEFRSIEKSFIICLNWRIPDGQWNLVYGDETDDIKVSIFNPRELLRELENKNKYMYPLGCDLKRNSIQLRPISLPEIPDTIQNDENYSTIGSYESTQ